jgi:membrane-bound inhibitor of C-type lysozyme
MSYTNNPNDSNYTVNQAVAPVVEAVEPERSNLRWLWWLLGLLALGALIWGLAHACNRDEPAAPMPTATAVPAQSYELTCDNHHFAVHLNEGAETGSVRINDSVDVALTHAEAASGARYIGNVAADHATETVPAGEVVVWNHGADWMTSVGGAEETVPCTVGLFENQG